MEDDDRRDVNAEDDSRSSHDDSSSDSDSSSSESNSSNAGDGSDTLPDSSKTESTDTRQPVTNEDISFGNIQQHDADSEPNADRAEQSTPPDEEQCVVTPPNTIPTAPSNSASEHCSSGLTTAVEQQLGDGEIEEDEADTLGDPGSPGGRSSPRDPGSPCERGSRGDTEMDNTQPAAIDQKQDDDDHISLNDSDRETQQDDLEQRKECAHTAEDESVKASPSIEQTDDHIELDYDIDITQELSAADLINTDLSTSTSDKLAEELPAVVVVMKQEEEEEKGKDETTEIIKEPPVIEESAKDKTKKVKEPDSEEEGELVSDSDGELTVSDEEDAVKDEIEDGEIQEGRNFNARTQICKFFVQNQCTWGYNCRFLHPGINDKGNYQLIDRPGMRLPPGIYKPPNTETGDKEKEQTEEEEQVKEETKLELSAPILPPKPETPWGRGLRQAKEALKQASRKREMELDIDNKRMNMTLDDIKPKSKEHGGDDPYYDNLQYDELDPIQATTFEEYSKEDDWERAGFEETFEVEWTHANYELPHMQHPADRGEFRDDRLRQERDFRRAYDRGGRQRYRSPQRNIRSNYRDGRPDERRGLHRQALGSDGWVDPWQRVKPGDKRKNRRRSSSGSSSFSSLSGSSRHSSASSFSSRSRSRTRTPTPLRNVAKPKSVITPMGSNARPDDKRSKDQSQLSLQEQRPMRKGPEWPSGPSTNGDRYPSSNRNPAPTTLDRTTKDKYDKGSHEAPPPGGGATGRLSRKDQAAGTGSRKDAAKSSRRSSSASSSSSSSSSSSRSHSSSSSDDSSDSSSSSGSSSDGSSSSSSSASDSDDLYGGISKPKKEKRKRKKIGDPKRSKMRDNSRLSSSTSRPLTGLTSRKHIEDSVRETTTSTSKAGIKLTLVNKTKVNSKKRVLESPPPEQLPPTKKANLPLPERERPKPVAKPVPAPAKAKAPPTVTKSAHTPAPVSKPVATKMANKTVAAAAAAAAAAGKKSQPNRREELLKQLKAVEDAIAKKRSKN